MSEEYFRNNKKFEDSFKINENNKKDIEEDSDSILENCIYKSIDSSFIDSILNDDYYKDLFDRKDKI